MTKIAKLRRATHQIGRQRVLDMMNEQELAFTTVTEFAQPEAARIALHYAPGTQCQAWHQVGSTVTALYTWWGAWILFDKFSIGPGYVRTVVVVNAPTHAVALAAGELLLDSQQSFADLWAKAVDEGECGEGN